MKKIVSFLLLFTFGLSSCEKDDICDANTPTTPRLVITFYDDADPTTPANVVNLQVQGKDEEFPIVFNETATDSTKYYTNGNSISLPLKTNEDTATYTFTYNAASINRNTDTLTFNYTRQNIYVSRACGFKTNFVLDPLAPYVRGLNDANNWMLNITVLNRNIVSEDETHIEIVF